MQRGWGGKGNVADARSAADAEGAILYRLDPALRGSVLPAR